jgi:hypothetical protein
MSSCRNTEPRYGFYILNRHGLKNHAQFIYPEDELKPSKGLLQYRTYPEYTARRLAGTLPVPPPASVGDDPHAAKKDYGKPTVIGLWMHSDWQEVLNGIMTG